MPSRRSHQKRVHSCDLACSWDPSEAAANGSIERVGAQELTAEFSVQAYQQQAAAAAAGPGQLGNAGNHASLQHFAAQQGKMDQVRILASLQNRPLLTQPQ